MARFNNGIMGGFTGILGGVEGYIRKGQPVMRARRRKVVGSSDAQKACRQKMKVVNEFTRMITDFVRIGFGVDAAPTTKTANNLAKSYQLLHGLKGEYPNLEIDYPKVRVTSGTLEVVQNPTMVLEGSVLNFSWENDKIRDNSVEDDQLMILLYYPDRMIGRYRFTGARRGELKDSMKVLKLKPGERIEAYLSFRSDDRMSISNSVYVGFITGEAVIEAPLEILQEEITKAEPEFNNVEPEITQVEPKIAPATESLPAAAFKSKLIKAIERVVESRLKPAIPIKQKLILNPAKSTAAKQEVTFKSKLIAIIERIVEARLKPALPIERRPTLKKALTVEPEAAITFEPDIVINTTTSAEGKIESELAVEKKPQIKLTKKIAVEVRQKLIVKSESILKFKPIVDRFNPETLMRLLF
jgi:hypothetical protein